MRCPSCGASIADESSQCDYCGASSIVTTEVTTAQIVSAQEPKGREPEPKDSEPKSQMSFTDAIATCMSKYATFTGRAARPEFWWFYLFTLLACWFASFFDSARGMGFISWIVNLVLFLPSVAAITRRLHDTDRSGWWQLIGVTIIGLIPLVYWLSLPGDRDQNQYGKPVA